MVKGKKSIFLLDGPPEVYNEHHRFPFIGDSYSKSNLLKTSKRHDDRFVSGNDTLSDIIHSEYQEYIDRSGDPRELYYRVRKELEMYRRNEEVSKPLGNELLRRLETAKVSDQGRLKHLDGAITPPWDKISIDHLENAILDFVQGGKLIETNLETESESPQGFLKRRFKESSDALNPLLYSQSLMHDMREAGVSAVPSDEVRTLLKSKDMVALIGVSGCGKTRTCYDLCSGENFGFYFDWHSHLDMRMFSVKLDSIIPPEDNSNRGQTDAYTANSRMIIKKMFLCRYLILVCMKRVKLDFTPLEFLKLQEKAKMFKSLFDKVSLVLARCTDDNAVDRLFDNFLFAAKNDQFLIVLDEAQIMLKCQMNRHASSEDKSVASDGSFLHPRSFFSLMVRFIADLGLKAIWAGTHLRLGTFSLVASGAGRKMDDRIGLFVDFNYLSAKTIELLLDKWLVTDNKRLKTRIAAKLQGRPRFLASFIYRLNDDLSGKCSDEDLERVFDIHLNEITFEHSESLQAFWYKNCDLFLSVFDPKTADSSTTGRHHVLALLKELIFNFYLMDERRANNPPWYRHLVSTGLVMLSPVPPCSARICEPLVVQAGIEFLKHHYNDPDSPIRPDAPLDEIVNNYILKTRDEATRGKAVEMMCVVRLREAFWTNPNFDQYFPQAFHEIKHTIQMPTGTYDCRTDDTSHLSTLKQSFMNPRATHVVMPHARSGGADVVFGFFSFHIKTSWSSGSLSKHSSRKNRDTLDKTCQGDPELEKLAAQGPWIRIMLEFPTSPALGKKNEMIQNRGNTTTIIAGIDSNFVKHLLGERFIACVRTLLSKKAGAF